MSRPPTTAPGVKAEALGAWSNLCRLLDQLDAEGERVPCREAPAVWTSDEVEDRSAAVRWCCSCPALRECAAFATANREVAHTWGGRDYSTNQAGTRRTDHEKGTTDA